MRGPKEMKWPENVKFASEPVSGYDHYDRDYVRARADEYAEAVRGNFLCRECGGGVLGDAEVVVTILKTNGVRGGAFFTHADCFEKSAPVDPSVRAPRRASECGTEEKASG